MTIEMYIQTIITATRELFQDDPRFNEDLKEEPRVNISYKNGAIRLESISFLCDRGYSRLKIDGSGIYYITASKTFSLVLGKDYSFFSEQLEKEKRQQ